MHLPVRKIDNERETIDIGKMDQYKIIYSGKSDFGSFISENDMIKNLEEKVCLYINKGWSCVGGIVLCHDNGLVTRIYQTVIKKAD